MKRGDIMQLGDVPVGTVFQFVNMPVNASPLYLMGGGTREGGNKIAHVFCMDRTGDDGGWLYVREGSYDFVSRVMVRATPADVRFGVTAIDAWDGIAGGRR